MTYSVRTTDLLHWPRRVWCSRQGSSFGVLTFVLISGSLLNSGGLPDLEIAARVCPKLTVTSLQGGFSDTREWSKDLNSSVVT